MGPPPRTSSASLSSLLIGTTSMGPPQRTSSASLRCLPTGTTSTGPKSRISQAQAPLSWSDFLGELSVNSIRDVYMLSCLFLHAQCQLPFSERSIIYNEFEYHP